METGTVILNPKGKGKKMLVFLAVYLEFLIRMWDYETFLNLEHTIDKTINIPLRDSYLSPVMNDPDPDSVTICMNFFMSRSPSSANWSADLTCGWASSPCASAECEIVPMVLWDNMIKVVKLLRLLMCVLFVIQTVKKQSDQIFLKWIKRDKTSHCAGRHEYPRTGVLYCTICG